MRKLILAGAVGIVLSLGLVAAQGITRIPQPPQVLVFGNVVSETPGQTDYSGNARIIIDGLLMEADRIVVQGNVVRFEGNVRINLPGATRVLHQKDLKGRVEIKHRYEP
jgi:hypothetical protein